MTGHSPLFTLGQSTATTCLIAAVGMPLFSVLFVVTSLVIDKIGARQRAMRVVSADDWQKVD
jgi:hypothetical protein